MNNVPIRNYRWPVLVERDPNCLMHLAMDPQGTSRNLIDLTGNNNNGELKDGTFPVIITGPSHKSIKFDNGSSGTSRIVITNPSFNDEYLISFTFWARTISIGELAGYFFYTGNGGIILFGAATERASLWVATDATTGKYSFPNYSFPYSNLTAPIKYANWSFVGIAIDRTPTVHPATMPDPIMVINDSEIVPSSVTQGTGNPVSEGSADSIIGNAASLNRAIDGTIDDFRVFNRLLTVEEMRYRYLQGARKPTTYHHRTSWPVDTASKTTGYAGPWSIRAGTAQYEDDGEHRGVTSKANGTRVVIPSKQVYGSWYFRWKMVAGQVMRVMITATSDEAYDNSNQNGYSFIPDLSGLDRIGFYRITSGTETGLVWTATDSIVAGEYEFFISRDSITWSGLGDSRFRLWLRGNGYDTWTLVLTAYSNTVRSCEFFNLEKLQNNSEFKDLRIFLGPFNPNDHPELRDPIAA